MNKLEYKNRIVWVDHAKGVAIILVILGHLEIPELWKDIIYSFHMQWFFFLSGYFFPKDKEFKRLLAVRAQSLLLPYVVFGLMLFGIELLRGALANNLESAAYAGLVNFLTGGMFWFLPVLFFTTLAAYGICHIVDIKWYPVLILLLGLLHGFVQPYRQILGIGIFVHVVPGVLYFLFGYYFKRYVGRPSAWSGLIYAFIYSVVLYLGDGKFGLQTIVSVSNIPYAYSLAFSGILAMNALCAKLPVNSLLVFLGQNSLLLYLLHGYPGFLSSRLLRWTGVMAWSHPTLVTLIQVALNIALLIPIVVGINRYAPWSIGRHVPKKSLSGVA
ncbi:acyltransferase family protein [Megalodesulfovibrio paquesii]